MFEMSDEEGFLSIWETIVTIAGVNTVSVLNAFFVLDVVVDVRMKTLFLIPVLIFRIVWSVEQ